MLLYFQIRRKEKKNKLYAKNENIKFFFLYVVYILETFKLINIGIYENVTCAVFCPFQNKVYAG